MQTKTISTGETPKLTLDVQRNLKLVGIEGAHEIGISTRDDAKLDIQENAGSVVLSCNKDIEISVPINARIHITRVRGNAGLAQLSGVVDIDRVHGNLNLESIAALQIKRVDGNLTANDLGDAFECKGVGGNARITRSVCPISINAGGDVELHGVPGKVRANAGGNAQVRVSESDNDDIWAHISAGGEVSLDVSAGDVKKVEVTAGGNIDCKLAEGTNATVNITSANGTQTMTLGEGAGSVRLSCGGSVNLSGADSPNHTYQWREGKPDRAAKSIKLGAKRSVHIDCGTHLKLEGYDGDEVMVESGRAELRDKDGEIFIDSNFGCTVRVPNNTSVRTEVGAHTEVRDFAGRLHAETGAHCNARDCEGDIHIEAGAHAHLYGFSGTAHIEAGSEIKAEFIALTGECKLEAGSDLKVWLPQDANATVDLQDSRGHDAKTFGEGLHLVRANAGHRAKVLGYEPGRTVFGYDSEKGFVADLSPDFEKQVLNFSSQITSAAQQMADGLASINMPDWLRRETQDMHKQVEEATRRAQEKINRRMENATRRAERNANNSARKEAKKMKMNGDFEIDLPFFKRKFSFSSDGSPPAPPTPPPPKTNYSESSSSETESTPENTDAERLMILQMLQDKKITAAQAEQLLTALDG